MSRISFVGLIAVMGVAVPAGADDAPPNRRPGNQPRPQARDISAMFNQRDRNKNGFLDGDEIPPPLRRRLGQIDQNKDGKLSLEEMKKMRGRGNAGDPRERNTPPARGERKTATLKVGGAAPDFTLKDPSGKKEVTLSSFAGKQPVVLIFGSHT